MNSRIGKEVTPRQERLLAKYFDGECWLLEKVVASRLIRSSEEAKRYLDGLKNVRDICGKPDDRGSVDLWDNISQRISQEEKCAILLGKRAVDVRGSLLSVKLREISEWLSARSAWQVSGALTAACAGFLMFGISDGRVPEGGSAGDRIASVRPPDQGAEPASGQLSLVANRKAGTPRIIEKNYPAAFEVDWMRSDGRVRVMQDSDQRAAIFWVKRKRPSGAGFFDSRRPSLEDIFVNGGNQPSNWTVLGRNGER